MIDGTDSGQAMRKVAMTVVLFVTAGLLVVLVAGGQQGGIPQQPRQLDKADLRARAERGEAEAQYNLCVECALALDFTQAALWCRKAAEQGYPKAQNSLGLLYTSGQGVLQDYVQAVAWWRKAAEQGFAKAQNNLGIAYAFGEGVPVDSVEAHKWLNLAASRASRTDLQAFVETRNDIEKKMTREQVLEAQRRAREWTEAFDRRQKK